MTYKEAYMKTMQYIKELQLNERKLMQTTEMDYERVRYMGMYDILGNVGAFMNLMLEDIKE